MWERRAERLMRGPRGLHTRLRAGGVSDRQAERALGLAPKTVCRWGCRGSYPRFTHAMRLRALVSDLSRGMDLSRVPDGFYAGAERRGSLGVARRGGAKLYLGVPMLTHDRVQVLGFDVGGLDRVVAWTQDITG